MAGMAPAPDIQDKAGTFQAAGRSGTVRAAGRADTARAAGMVPVADRAGRVPLPDRADRVPLPDRAGRAPLPGRVGIPVPAQSQALSSEEARVIRQHTEPDLKTDRDGIQSRFRHLRQMT